MASTWPGSTCGYCGASESTRYDCPVCKRTGCPTCMPDGEDVEGCNYCKPAVKRKEYGFGHNKHVDI